MAKLEIKYMSPSILVPYIGNPRFNQPIAEVQRSIEHFGFVNPIIARKKDNMIVAGHTRWKAALKAELKEIPVIYVDFTENDSKLYNLTDNKLGELAEWDMPQLQDILQELKDFDVDISIAGFDDMDLIGAGEGLTDPDDIPEVQEEPITKTGDLWLMGKHRLLCGDSTKKEDVGRLMAGKKVDMVFTDPPYNMGKAFENDKLEWNEYINFANKILINIYNYSNNDCAIYWFGSFRSLAKTIDTFEKYFLMKREIVWIKSVSQGMDRFPQSCEYLFYGEKGNPSFYQDTIRTNWREYNFGEGLCKSIYEDIEEKGNNSKYSKGRNKRFKADKKIVDEGIIPKNYWIFKNRQGGYNFGQSEPLLHVSEKPVELCERGILASSLINNLVLDIFLGSGTTIIACEQTGRLCYSLEIDPHYCDVSVKRWEDFTGLKAELER